MIESTDRAPLLRPGTVVSFQFPLGEGEGRAKTRPCLVIATSHDADGQPLVTVAYATSAATHSNRGLDLRLSDPEDWQAAGLRRPSRFVLARRVTVPLTDPGFDGRRTGSPVIGHLPPSTMIALQRMTRSIGSRIPEDCRQGAQGIRLNTRLFGRHHRTVPSRRGRSTSQHTFIVEHRRRRSSRSTSSAA